MATVLKDITVDRAKGWGVGDLWWNVPDKLAR